ncbi:unnamed protein product, partial [Meganyctiphanes norvegica]
MINKQSLTLAGISLIAGLVIGGIIGHFATPSVSQQEREALKTWEQLSADNWVGAADNSDDDIINMVNANNIRENLKILTSRPHLAATPRDDELAEMLQQRFKESGFDTAEMVPYRVLLSRPNATNPNLITLHDGTREMWQSRYKEDALHPDDEAEDFVHAFNAYTPAGKVSTPPGTGVVYVNYGRVEDFDKLESLGVNVSGHIAIARYGKIFRGNKVHAAQERGAVGIIIYSDPEDVAVEGVEPTEVYPNTWFLPGSGMQRGGTFLGDGDPLTPGWPSTANAYRVDKEDAGLPKIPCQPIGYDDAKVILEKLDGAAAPSSWIGGLEGVSYQLGPAWKPEYSEWSITLTSHNTENIYRSYNVIATMKGHLEPDRYVVLGNHRDAWGFGGSDPSSGTAQLLETARVLGELKRKGWRPRRTLVFCSWGAEEYGLIGSREWVEEHILKLQSRSVAYINTDTCASGPIFQGKASPLLWDTLENVVKKIPGVRDGPTLYDEWVAYEKRRFHFLSRLKTLGSGSDYAAFTFYGGIPSMDIWFRADRHAYNLSIYPTYHTGFDTFYTVDKYTDPGFKIHQGCSRVALMLLKYFGDSAVIPYSLQQLPKAMAGGLKAFKDKDLDTKLIEIYDKYVLLSETVDNLTVATQAFMHQLKERKAETNPLILRAINDQMMNLEQAFVLPEGLPGRPGTRHAVFAPSQFDSYAAAGFPGISDLLYKIDDLSQEEKISRHKQIRRHISDLTIRTNNAINMLKEAHS